MSNTRARKPGGGRKPSKPEYSAAKNLAQQMKAAADLYTDKMSLQAIADALSLNPIKVRKLLITAGVYESDTAKLVRQTFNTFRETQNYSTAVTSIMAALQLSRPSVTSYLPYAKGVYFPETAEAGRRSFYHDSKGPWRKSAPYTSVPLPARSRSAGRPHPSPPPWVPAPAGSQFQQFRSAYRISFHRKKVLSIIPCRRAKVHCRREMARLHFPTGFSSASG